MGTTSKGYPYPEGTDLVIDGDDAIQALAEAVDDKLPYAVATGTGHFPTTDSNKGSNLTVTFPPGRFSTTPSVVVNANTSAPQTRFVAAQTVALTSFIARYVNAATTAADMDFQWIAIQQLAAAALMRAAAVGDDPGITTVLVACPNSACPYYAYEMEAIMTFTDDEGNVITTDSIQCGGCGTEMLPEEG